MRLSTPTVLLGILIVLCLAIGFESLAAYLATHGYYGDMLADITNRKIVVWFVLLAGGSIYAIVNRPTFSIVFMAQLLGGSVFVSSLVHSVIKGGIVGPMGMIGLIINTAVLLAIASYFVVSMVTIGGYVYTRIARQTLTHWYDVLMSFGLGMVAFCLINVVLIQIHAFYPIVAWIQFVAMGYVIYICSDIRRYCLVCLDTALAPFFVEKSSSESLVYWILAGLSLIYIYYAFNLGFIPYSTAWDANHAYMYYPKVWALNNGLFWSNGPGVSPSLWMVYISYWFSLRQPMPKWFLAPDTIAVFMNMLAGPFALLTGIGLVRQVISFMFDKLSPTRLVTAMTIGRGYLLLWVSSGMGAFLVFVDNKTDLGVMTMTVLALMSGFVMLSYIQTLDSKNILSDSKIPFLAGLSGLFFASASLAKPTAFQDILLFALLMIALWAGPLGAVGVFLMSLGYLAYSETMAIVFFLSKNTGLMLLGAGAVLTFIQVAIAARRGLLVYMRPLCIWVVSILAVLFVVKSPYLIGSAMINDTFAPSTYVKGVLMGSHRTFVASTNTGSDVSVLNTSGSVAPSSDSLGIKPASCSMDAIRMNTGNLYTGLGQIEGGGLVEDFGRYLGFGQREFKDPASYSLAEKKSSSWIKLGYYSLYAFFHTPGCYSLDPVADKLCEDPSITETVNVDALRLILSNTDKNEKSYGMISGVVRLYDRIQTMPTMDRPVYIAQLKKTLTDYVAGNVIVVTEQKNDPDIYTHISVPYFFLTPLNVTFNRSLQNLSSYYTDIGFIRLLPMVLVMIAVVYSAVSGNRKLLALSLTTLMGWIIWWFIASGIIRYAVGLIAWTIVTIVSLLLTRYDSDELNDKNMFIYILLGVLAFFGCIQMICNIFRLASQGGAGPFVSYKGGVGEQYVTDVTAQGFAPRRDIKVGYTAKDVFDMQFGHYNRFMDMVRTRKDTDGVLIAGTYLQYFVENQSNLSLDGLLTEFWKWTSDENSCAASQRLIDKNIKYLVIDPNIGSVVMGGGNATLFDRFFAKLDPATNKILKHGTMTMLGKMVKEGYLKFHYSNNLGATYAYALDDATINTMLASFPAGPSKDLLMRDRMSEPYRFRAMLVTPRFFGQAAMPYMELIMHILSKRLATPAGASDMADVFGKTIDPTKIEKLLTQLTAGSVDQALIASLTADEKFVMSQFMGLYQAANTPSMAKQLSEATQSILSQSIGGGSQLIVFERVL